MADFPLFAKGPLADGGASTRLGHRRPTLSPSYLSRFFVVPDAARPTSYPRSLRRRPLTFTSSRRPPLRFEPSFKVLKANLVLNLWMSHDVLPSASALRRAANLR